MLTNKEIQEIESQYQGASFAECIAIMRRVHQESMANLTELAKDCVTLVKELTLSVQVKSKGLGRFFKRVIAWFKPNHGIAMALRRDLSRGKVYGNQLRDKELPLHDQTGMESFLCSALEILMNKHHKL